MAGPYSPNARVRSLKNDFGPLRGPNSPDTFLVALLVGVPGFGGVELDDGQCPGYVRVEIDNDDFIVGTDGLVSISVPIGDATGPWLQVADTAALLDAADPSEMWDYVPIERVRVTAAGPVNPVIFTVNYADDATVPA